MIRKGSTSGSQSDSSTPHTQGSGSAFARAASQCGRFEFDSNLSFLVALQIVVGCFLIIGLSVYRDV